MAALLCRGCGVKYRIPPQGLPEDWPDCRRCGGDEFKLLPYDTGSLELPGGQREPDDELFKGTYDRWKTRR
jgi:hypothetical protein